VTVIHQMSPRSWALYWRTWQNQWERRPATQPPPPQAARGASGANVGART